MSSSGAVKKFQMSYLSFWVMGFGLATASFCLALMPDVLRGMCFDTRVPRALRLVVTSVQLGGWLPLLLALGWKLVRKLWDMQWHPLLALLPLPAVWLVLGLTFVHASTTSSCTAGRLVGGHETWTDAASLYFVLTLMLFGDFWWVALAIVAVVSIVLVLAPSGAPRTQELDPLRSDGHDA